MDATHTVETPTHGRYIVRSRRKPGRGTIVGFHGYAEHAERHLDRLSSMPGSERWRLVAVQALHRFYTRGDDVVVASWMTRQDRELAIADNLEYVRRVVDALRNDDEEEDPLIFVGFSQGASMAWRAAGAVRAAAVVAIAGDIAPEVDLAAMAERGTRALVVRGRMDEWYGDEKAAADVERLTLARVGHEMALFDGGHEWPRDPRIVSRWIAARVAALAPT
jgi:predicted esterase